MDAAQNRSQEILTSLRRIARISTTNTDWLIAETKRDRPRRECIPADTVRKCFTVIGFHLRMTMEAMGRISLECRDLVVDALDRADFELQAMFGDEFDED